MTAPTPTHADLFSALDSACTVMALHSRDWSADRGDAWLWGIFVGWEGDPDDDADAMDEVAAKHRWSPDDVARLRTLRAAVAAYDITAVASLPEPIAPAPTGPEPEERHVGCVWATAYDQAVAECERLQPYEAQVSALQADVARLERERDRLRVEAKDARAEVRQLAHELGLTAAERDEARAELEDRGKALAQYQLACGQHQAAAFEAQTERDEAQRMLAGYEREHPKLISSRRMVAEQRAKAEAERDAMRPVVEAAEAWRRKRYGPAPIAVYHEGFFSPLERALIAAVDQMGARTALGEPGSDGSGSGVGGDAPEAQKGARGARCLCAEVDIGTGVGYRETMRGRTNPECPFHGREVRTDG